MEVTSDQQPLPAQGEEEGAPSSHPQSPPQPEVVTDPTTGLKVVIIGCVHGELDAMYESILYLQEQQNIKIDLVLCCGDFQAVRNMTDLNALACPPKYRRINTFYKYYAGEVVAPVLTLFVGGNHEASNHLTELYYGGWVAPNIYYLGMSGVVNFGGLRIGGLSGIYKKFDYDKGHYEMPPYTDDAMRSVYHIREFEVFKLMQLTRRLDVMLSHDWPRNIAYHGDKAQLLRCKPFLRNEIESGVFGSPPGEQLLHTLQPEYWFAAHMHVKFAAVVQHAGGQATKFLALDKVMANRNFLQVWEFPAATGPRELTYDEEWLAITKSTNHLLSFSRGRVALPKPSHGPGRFDYRPTEEELEWVRKRVAEVRPDEGLRVPHNFAPVAPSHAPGDNPRGRPAGELCASPQREAFLALLDLPDPFVAYAEQAMPLPQQRPQQHQHQHQHQYQPPPLQSFAPGQPPPFVGAVAAGATLTLAPLLSTGLSSTKNEEEIDLDALEDDDDDDNNNENDNDEGQKGEEGQSKRQKLEPPQQLATSLASASSAKNEEEIDLDEDDNQTD